MGHLTDPKIDRAPAAKQLKELMRRDKELDTEYHQALLKSLDLALVPGKGKPGTVEALIDDLVNYSADTGTIGVFEPEDRYWRIARLGFEAVPALIEHLDDERLSRAMMQGFNNFSSWHLRVGDVVGDLLEGLAGEEVGRNWLRRQQGYRVEKAEVKKWWEKARKAGEEAYLLDHVLSGKDSAFEEQAARVSPHVLAVIEAKHPRHVPALYRKVLDERPNLSSWPLAEAVLRCKVPAKEKVDLLVHGASHQDCRHRLAALHALKELDRRQFSLHLLAALENCPKDVSGPYWTCPEGGLGALAMECDDPRVWQVLEKVARRSAVGLRMELLNHLDDPQDHRHRAERLRLLSGFLEDATLRDEQSSSKFEGPVSLTERLRSGTLRPGNSRGWWAFGSS